MKHVAPWMPESHLTDKVQEDRAAVLGVGVGCKVNLLLAKLVEQLRAGAWELHPHPLNAVPELGGDGLHNGNGAVLIEIDLHRDHALIEWRGVMSRGHAFDAIQGIYVSSTSAGAVSIA